MFTKRPMLALFFGGFFVNQIRSRLISVLKNTFTLIIRGTVEVLVNLKLDLGLVTCCF